VLPAAAENMKIKSYFAHTVEDAMAVARQELGPEAMLVNSRRAQIEARHLGEYEVIFVTDAPEGEPGSPPVIAAANSTDRISTEVAELKRELEGMRRMLTHSAYSPPHRLDSTPDASAAYAALTGNDVDAELARDIVEAAEARVTDGPAAHGIRRDGSAYQVALAEEVGSRFAVEPVLGRGEGKPRVVALVGPPGSGKTTTLVKLAVQYGLAGRRPALLLSMDTYRIGAADQLRSYAGIVGIAFQLLETVTALSQAIEENHGKELIFIDTPGLGRDDMHGAAALAQMLCSRSDIDTQLVLPASMKAADLRRLTEQFEIFRPQRLLFSKLDETGSFGPLLNEAARTAKPLSFLTTGQRIPEDLETASRTRIVDLVLSGRSLRAASAA
jgi:flagellar biosynthesis protein FlhF